MKKLIRKILKEETKLSLMIRRRVPMDELEQEFIKALETAEDIYKRRYSHLDKKEGLYILTRITIEVLIDGLHYHIYSTTTEDEEWYDDVFDNLKNYFKDRIKQRLDEIFGEDINESIKKSLNESKNKFNRENSQKGKYSDLLETLTTNFLGKENVCDVFAMYTEGTYAVLVYYNGNAGFYLNEKLDDFLTKYTPIDLFSHIIITKCDEE
jgi:hypothetical protein